jgi:hypothetical protein
MKLPQTSTKSKTSPDQKQARIPDRARLLLAENHLTRRLPESILRRIWALPVPAD